MIQFKDDWLKYFKVAVRMAKDARLKGNTEKACRLDQTIEAFYRENKDDDLFNENDLFEIETNIRNES